MIRKLITLLCTFQIIFLNAFVPVVTPNRTTLKYEMDNGVKVFQLTAEPVVEEFSDGFHVNCWGYNGSSPGPTIEAVEGDRVRIKVTNRLSEPTTIHWHGIILPNDMDGVSGLTQKPIPPGETYIYEFTLKQNGTYMYHPHFNSMVQIGLGMMGFFIIHPKEAENPPIDKDFAIFVHEWAIPIGGATPNPWSMDFNYFTFNGCLFPKADPLLVKTGERVRIRLANLSMDSHPIHLHGYIFTVTSAGGGPLPRSIQYPATTINVAVGNTNDIEFLANAPGDWALHCHKTHHNMSGMIHTLPNMIGVNMQEVDKKLSKLIPGIMPLDNGMEMAHMRSHIPQNFPVEGKGPYGPIDMTGMFTIVKVGETPLSAKPLIKRPTVVKDEFFYSE